MESETNTFNIQIEQILEEEDLEGLNQLVQRSSPDEINQFKTQLTDAYLTIYSIWYYDWICNKIDTQDPAGFIFSLLEILQSAKVALKSGDREKCLTILKECQEVFTTEYSVYGFDHVLQDEDFREIWQHSMIQASY